MNLSPQDQLSVSVVNPIAAQFSSISHQHLHFNRVSFSTRTHHDYVSIVSHDLRTPLTNVRGFLELISMGVYRDSPELMAEQALQITRNIDDLMLMISEFLHADIIASGKVPLGFDWIDSSDLASDALAHVKFIALTCDVNLSVSLKTKRLFADRGRLLQILVNLLSNAVRSTSKGGSVNLSIDETNDRWNFTVSDTGQGIPLSRLSSMFSDSSKLGAVQTSIRETGLGLTISRALVEAHGGQISVQSEPNVGTKFQFYIPRKQVCAISR